MSICSCCGNNPCSCPRLSDIDWKTEERDGAAMDTCLDGGEYEYNKIEVKKIYHILMIKDEIELVIDAMDGILQFPADEKENQCIRNLLDRLRLEISERAAKP